MKKNNKKGFTIVELVIVIAVIAILAAVLIPTFSNVVDKANDSADLQAARNLYTEYLAVVDAQPADVVFVKGGTQYFKFTKGQIDEDEPVATVPPTDNAFIVTMTNNVVDISCAGKHGEATGEGNCTVCGDRIG